LISVTGSSGPVSHTVSVSVIVQGSGDGSGGGGHFFVK